MRTTLDIDEDLPAANIARHVGASVAGFEPFPAKPGVVTTNEQVNALRDAEGV